MKARSARAASPSSIWHRPSASSDSSVRSSGLGGRFTRPSGPTRRRTLIEAGQREAAKHGGLAGVLAARDGGPTSVSARVMTWPQRFLASKVRPSRSAFRADLGEPVGVVHPVVVHAAAQRARRHQQREESAPPSRGLTVPRPRSPAASVFRSYSRRYSTTASAIDARHRLLAAARGEEPAVLGIGAVPHLDQNRGPAGGGEDHESGLLHAAALAGMHAARALAPPAPPARADSRRCSLSWRSFRMKSSPPTTAAGSSPVSKRTASFSILATRAASSVLASARKKVSKPRTSV